MARKRIYSEKEAAEIMQRAVRMQEESGIADTYTPGLTDVELQKIAAEAGIDPAFLERAKAGIDVEDKSTVGPFNLTEEFERVVDGEMDPENFDRILGLMRPNTQRGISQVGRTLTGTGAVGPHMVHLQVESRKGRTKVKVKYSPVFAYLIGLHGPLIGSVIALGILGSKGNILLGAGIACALLGFGGAAFNWLVKTGRQAAKRLTGQIVEVVEDEVEPLRENLASSSQGAGGPVQERQRN